MATDSGRNPHGAHGLLGRAAAGTGDTAGGYGAVAAGHATRARRHLPHYRFAHRAVSVQIVTAHSKHVSLHIVAIGHYPTAKVLAAAGNERQAVGYIAAGATLGRRHREATLTQTVADDCRQRLVATANGIFSKFLLQPVVNLVHHVMQ